jgi:hypothetical protein
MAGRARASLPSTDVERSTREEDTMNRTTALLAALLACVPAAAPAQTKTVPGEMITVTAKVEAIELQSRTLTLKKPDGQFVTLVAPAEVARFDAIKVGDTVTARYYDTLTFRKMRPDEKAVDSATGGVAAAPGSRPAATVSAQRTVTTTITAIDEKVPSITFTGPNKVTYSQKVSDRAALKMVKVGDRVEITWTEAVSIAVTAPR